MKKKTTICESCGSENPSTARFCGECAAELPKIEPEPETEKEPTGAQRFPLIGVVAVTVLVTAVATTLIMMMFRDSDGDPEVASATAAQPTATADPSATATPTPTPSETTTLAPDDQLSALLPPELSGCETLSVDAAEIPDGFGAPTASIGCIADRGDYVGGPDPTASFFLYATEEETIAAYNAFLDRLQVRRGDGGDCSKKGGPGEFSWSGAGGEGRLICYEKEEGAGLLWISDGFPVLGVIDWPWVIMSVPGPYEVWQGISDYTR
jgi:hypothetical protein